MDPAKTKTLKTREVENLPCPCGSKLYHVIGPKTDLWACPNCPVEGKTYEEARDYGQTLRGTPARASK